MARLSRGGFLLIAVAFHLVYMYSIFDIYFVSPIVSGMRPFKVEGQPAPAKRLVLFVGDGLRADKAFQSFPDPSSDAPNTTDALTRRPLAPFLRSRVLEHGTFGVSHTRVPTESRPGHVALIAGLYEDVSAVTTGWKLNPVNFDSVFNRSRHTWSWGSPDICPMFKEGAVPGRVDSDTYPPHFEDYSKDSMVLDTWVFDKVRDMFGRAKSDPALDSELRQEKNVFFLHLLGLDSTGHTHRPYSKDYLQNIQLVDRGVEEMTRMIEDFYGDGQTAFVFTADHGMSDWGSHGDGHPDNTRTPLIAWGSGVAKPEIVSQGKAPGHEDGFSSDWGLDHVRRHDVAQADIAALMAYLAGLEFPVNSVGELPLTYLTADAHAKAQAKLTNAKGILEMYRIKEEEKQAVEISFKPYGPFSKAGETPAERVRGVQSLIDTESSEEAIAQSDDLIREGLQGLRYLQTYDWLFLRTLVTLGYLGWMAFALTTVIDLHVLSGSAETSRSFLSLTSFSSAFVLLCSFLYVRGSSLTYYAYAVFPVFFWEEVYARKQALLQGGKALFGSAGNSVSAALKALAFVGVLEALVQSYIHREMYSICYFLAIFWPVYYGADFIQQNFLLIATWSFSCMSMALFTLLPAVKVENLDMIMIGGGLMVTAGVLYLLIERSLVAEGRKDGTAALDSNFSRGVFGVQVGLVLLAMLVTRSSVTSLQARQGLALGTQIVGWVVLVASLTVPFLHGLQPNNHYLHRLAVIFLSFAPSFIILTISYEGLFYFAFALTLVTWVRMEHRIFTFTNPSAATKATPSTTTPDPTTNGHTTAPSPEATPNGKTTHTLTSTPLAPALSASTERLSSLHQKTYRKLTLADARISLFFLYLLQSAFFSTGNIASVSSFSLDAVYRLIPVFDPFSQGALLLFKLLIPFALISANLGILNRRLGVAPSALFMLVTAFSDVLTLNFFWMVRDEGSWLEIGETISRFVIASLLCVFVAGLEGLSGLMVEGVGFDDDDDGDGDMVAKGEEDGRACRKQASGARKGEDEVDRELRETMEAAYDDERRKRGGNGDGRVNGR